MRSAGRRRPLPRGSIAAPTAACAPPPSTVLPLGLAWLPSSVRVVETFLEDAGHLNGGPRIARCEQLIAFELRLERRIPEELLRCRARLEITTEIAGGGLA